MVISLIGLSGCGKSELARQFSVDLGWKVYSCDSLIESRIIDLLDIKKEAGTGRTASWLGQPYESGYRAKEKIYLNAEEEVLEEILNSLIRQPALNSQVLIDTTGSVIHCRRELLISLAKLSTVVYLEIPNSDQDLLFQQFIADPKPVLWMESYLEDNRGDNKGLKETQRTASSLQKSYSNLLADRCKKYENLAKFTIGAGFAERAELTPSKVIKIINAK